MKTQFRYLFMALALLPLASINWQFSTAFAQGVLTPPGPPAPTMKTLDQIEPRMPISAVPFVIINPGSYYLVSNLDLTVNTNAIIIATNEVTLDLKGFTISTSVLRGTGAGILLSGGVTDITIFNGHITGGNFQYLGSGITCAGTSPVNVHVADLLVAGCQSYGINLGTNNSTAVESCQVQAVNGYGILAGTVSHSAAYECGNTAIFALTLATDCTGVSLNGDGVEANLANGCYGYAEGSGWGIYANAAAIDCYGSVGDGSGVPFSAGIFANMANHCYGSSGGVGLGMFALSASYCYCISSGSNGLDSILATGCYCQGGGSGLDLFTDIAVGCYENSGNITFKYNMP